MRQRIVVLHHQKVGTSQEDRDSKQRDHREEAIRLNVQQRLDHFGECVERIERFNWAAFSQTENRRGLCLSQRGGFEGRPNVPVPPACSQAQQSRRVEILSLSTSNGVTAKAAWRVVCV